MKRKNKQKSNNTKQESESTSSDFSASVNDFNQPKEHIPVLLSECLEALNIRANLTYVDATIGAGGHFFEIEKRLTYLEGKLIGFDRDPACAKAIAAQAKDPDLIINSNYSNIKEALTTIGINTISGGILADLGVSSMQLDTPQRGFSFQTDAPLDMRMDTGQALTAEQLINNCEEKELSDIIFKYGEDRHSRRIANAIVRNRPIHSTLELAQLVSRTLNRFQKGRTKLNMTSGGYKKWDKHPATRTFQAIRIAVNEELSSLEFFLNQAVEMLEPGARLAVISFHSLEDRIVKQFLKEKASDCICPAGYPVCKCSKVQELRILTRKPVTASETELDGNPRARSAKLRIAERV